MIDPSSFLSLLLAKGLSFFTGVPDSLLKELCSCITDMLPAERHIIAANEGGAVGLAAGYYLATKNAGVVYMQNSGTGNAINPLLSLADPDVYSVPMLLIIGWRGEPNVKDEPQHIKQGRVQEELLRSLGYSYEILDSDLASATKQIERLTYRMHMDQTPVVLLVRKGTFSCWEKTTLNKELYSMAREEALKIIIKRLPPDACVVSTTGMISREIYELRDQFSQGHERDFLSVGSMGHAVMVALGVSLFNKRPTICIDGDGAVLMHMGSLAIVGSYAKANFHHILLNNGAHDSVGGQPTIGFNVPFKTIAENAGYKACFLAEGAEALSSVLDEADKVDGPSFIEVRVHKGARSDLGRPKTKPIDNKVAFMEYLG